MPGRLGFTMIDNSREKASFSLATGEVTAVSLPGLLTEVGDLRGAIEGITLGNVHKEQLSVFDSTLTNAPPASELAQVETVWVVVYEDTLEFFDDPVNAIPNEGYGKLFTLKIPTADIVGRLQLNSDEADLTDTQIAAFVSAFETTARSPYGGSVTVRRIYHQGHRA